MNSLKQKLNDYLLKFTNPKNNVRWICNRDPNLWSEILETTIFLPNNAKPKQRCWHILNEYYEIPKCPTTNKEVKWQENRYLTYFDLSAKSSNPAFQEKCLKTYNEKTGTFGHWRTHTAIIEKSNKTFYENFYAGNHIKQDYKNTRSKTSKWAQSIQQKWSKEKRNSFSEQIKNQWASFSPEKRNNIIIKHKTRFTIEIRYKLSVQRRKPKNDAKIKYYEEVSFWTKISWINHFYEINPLKIKRDYKNQLDHIYSISSGFKNNIDAKIIGHWTNLQIIPNTENQKKSTKNGKSIEQLFEDYNKSTK